jgi:hypothetical protein
LSKKKERRDAAYKVLKLILYTLRRPREHSACLPAARISWPSELSTVMCGSCSRALSKSA